MKFKLFLVGLIAHFIFTTVQAGWNLQHSGTYQLYDIDFPRSNTNTGFACGEQPFGQLMFFKTTNGGDIWEMITATLPSPSTLNAINFPMDEMVGYIACDSGNVAITQNGGNDWQITNTGTNHNLNGIHFPFETDIGYVVGMQGWVARTFNSGLNWTDVSLPMPRDLYNVHFISPAEGWVVGAEGTIAHTTNTGDSWVIQNSGVSEQLLGVYFRDANNGWVVGVAKTCLKTTNGGQNWESVNIPLPPNTILYSVMFPVNIDSGFICGSSGRIAKTTNRGNTWDTITLNPPANFYRVEFPVDNQTGWVCGSGEAIFKTTDGGWIEEPNLGQGVVEQTLLALPNPFRSKTVIRFAHPLDRNTDLKVYDCLGQLIRTLALNNNGVIKWDGRNESNQRVKSGVYLLELKINRTFAQRLKLTLLD